MTDNILMYGGILQLDFLTKVEYIIFLASWLEKHFQDKV